MASLKVVASRLEQADAKHDHVELVGYHSLHLAAEPIMLSPERVIQLTALGSRFYIVDGDAEHDVVEGKCPLCGHEPYLRTKGDQGDEQKLMNLPPG
ncbi:MAG TPA: hypothetical protein VM841_04595 [Actinomycetota bacterium]|nr:hypothetical protein [Actinomycetota bacterium]